MTSSLSIEIQVPDDIDHTLVTAIGERCYPYDADGEPMTIGEALQYAFSDPGGVSALALLGVTWTTMETR
jgi:hypothetical protein